MDNKIKLYKLDLQFFAQKKGGGSASTNRSHDSVSKRRGVKVFGGEKIKTGSIIVRQLGTRFLPGKNTFLAKDFTIHSSIDGVVSFKKKQINYKKKTIVEVIGN